MSKVWRTTIGNQNGFYMRNDNVLSYDDCIKNSQTKIFSSAAIRYLTINKYIPLRYLLVLLQEKRLILKPVSSWEDPYENFFLKERFVLEGELNSSHCTSVVSFINGFYGMSWSTQEETDSLWRIYSPDKLSVKITTTVEKLAPIISCEDNKWGVWIGNVHYKTEEELNAWLDKCVTVNNVKQFINKIGSSFFIKRKAFVAEREFRIIVNYFDKQHPIPTYSCFEINPNSFISDFVVDPRLNKYEYGAIRAALIDAGACADNIRLSNLYEFNPRNVEMRYNPFWDF